MKKVLLALALIIGTSSIADAGDLDGKALWCPAYNIGLVFAEGKVTNYYLKGYVITKGEGKKYILVGTSEVLWEHSIATTNTLNRETLVSQKHGRCYISSKQKIMMILKAIIANAKKKNKI